MAKSSVERRVQGLMQHILCIPLAHLYPGGDQKPLITRSSPVKCPYPLVIKHGNGRSSMNGGLDRTINYKWFMFHCHDPCYQGYKCHSCFPKHSCLTWSLQSKHPCLFFQLHWSHVLPLQGALWVGISHLVEQKWEPNLRSSQFRSSIKQPNGRKY